MIKQLEIFDIENNNHEAKSYTGIYGLHKYWSKKPYNVIRNFINEYTRENEIVLDPFMGSGISITESIITNRKAIGIDINPSAVFITNQLLVKVSTKKMLDEFKNLSFIAKHEIEQLYKIIRNGKEFIGTHFLWNKGCIEEIWYKDDKKKIVTIPNEEDIKFIESFYNNINSYFYPKQKFYHNTRINADRNKSIKDLFTPRNLLALSILMHHIENITDNEIKDLFKFCFTSSIGQASKMVFVVKNRGKNNGHPEKSARKEVGSWVIGYWIPEENFEINVWNCFENRFGKILKAKSQQENTIYHVNKADDFEEIKKNNKNLLLFNRPAQEILTTISDNSIDYIITDPPHGNRIPYLELSMLWNSWLKFDVNYEDEIIVSESKDRHKDINDYNKLLNSVFKESYRVLKPDKYFSIMFNSLDDNSWLNLIQTLFSLGFKLNKIETLSYSANSVVQDNRKSGLKTDFIITFQKVNQVVAKQIEILSYRKHPNVFFDSLDELCNGNSNSFETYEILNHFVRYFLSRDLFFKISDVQEFINENLNYVDNKWIRD